MDSTNGENYTLQVLKEVKRKIIRIKIRGMELDTFSVFICIEKQIFLMFCIIPISVLASSSEGNQLSNNAPCEFIFPFNLYFVNYICLVINWGGERTKKKEKKKMVPFRFLVPQEG